MSPGAARVRAGFTLVETLIALVLSMVILLLVSHTFLVQNQFYATQTLRVGAQDNVRAATELMASEVRNVAEGGVVVAGARTLTVRSPMAIGVLCDVSGSGNIGEVLTDGGEGALDTDEVAGLALLSGGVWNFVNAPWTSVDGSDASSAVNCFNNGADTVGMRDEFHRLAGLATIFPSPLPTEGDAVMIFRETTFSIRPSQLDASALGLFRQSFGGTAVEFATGIDTTAQFRFRTAGAGFTDTVASGLADIDAVQIIAHARSRAPTGGAEDIVFGWSVNVPLRTIR